ncbi:MAG: hypothetical protein Aurels2KO_15160 [Aureliella sp.]
MGNITTTISALTFACTSLSVCVAQAQPVVAASTNSWNYQNHSSTPTEGYLRGTAQVIAAAGQKNYLDSIALVNFQEARRRAIENSKLYVKTFIENKEALRDYRKRYAPVPPTKEVWDQLVAASLPDRLTSSQYDPQSGKVVWPHILRTDDFTALRTRIDELLAKRSPADSGDGSPTQRELATLIDGMKQLLKSKVFEFTAGQYGSAQAFLKSLDYEMTFTMDNIAASSTPAAVGNLN